MPPTPIVAVSQRLIIPPAQDKIVVVGHVPGPQGIQGPPGPAGPIADLVDVDPTPPGDGDALFYNLSTQLWEPTPAATQAELDAVAAAAAASAASLYVPIAGATTVSGRKYFSSGIHLPGSPDVGADTQEDTPLLIGDGSGLNIAMDSNEIMFRNNGEQLLALFGGGYISFPATATDKILLYGDTYKIAVESSTLAFTTGRYVRFWESGDTDGSIYMDLNGNPTLRVEGNSSAHWLEIGYTDSSYARFATSATYWYFGNKPIRNDHYASYGGTIYLDVGTTTVAYATGDSTAFYMGVNETYALGHGANGVLIRTRDSTAGSGQAATLALWTQYGTDRHVNFFLHSVAGDRLYLRNYENTGWVGVQANDFQVMSTKKDKTRVRTARTERGLLDYAVPGERELAFGQMKKVRPVLFDDVVQESLRVWAGCDVHETREGCRDDPECPNENNYNYQNHICDDFWCDGTNDRPCWIIEQHVDRVGLIAEEIEEIYPKAISRDMNGENKGISYSTLAVELINVIQYLIEENEEQAERLNAIEEKMTQNQKRSK